ncbi:MAG TPA: hypothetical protein VLI91_05490 [Roseiarcus sp.]|nr:hypothetical protein [Roseiarcus sp.]
MKSENDTAWDRSRMSPVNDRLDLSLSLDAKTPSALCKAYPVVI